MKKLLLSIFCIVTSLFYAQSIERIEPPNWWVGMKYDTVSVLIYGKNISHLTPEFNYNGVKLLQKTTFENSNYIFLSIKIESFAKSGIMKINFSDNNKVIITKDFPLYERVPNSAKRKSYSQKDAICLIVPDRFSNGDETNDVVSGMLESDVNRDGEGKRHGGDLQGIINHLDYIQSLGYTQIWCTPMIENNQPEYSYHGYAATDFYKMDPRYGSNELVKVFVDEAGKRGMGVIWDVVLNHCGTEYYFVKDLPCKDWINYPDSKTRCNFMKASITDKYATDIDRKEYYEGWFDGHMADLNQRNPLMAKFLIQNTIWWVEFAGISGIRADTYSYSDKDFLSLWSKTVTEEYPNINIVGEEMYGVASQVSYWQKDKVNFDGYKSYLPSLMDFALNENIIFSLNNTNDWFSTWAETYKVIALDYLFPHPENILIFPDNHDLDRFFTRVNKDLDKWKIGIALYMTMRGIPQFYYGTEVLMTNSILGNDGLRRGDFYGGWSGDNKNAFTNTGLTGEELEAKNYFTTLLNWRKNSKVIAEGKFIHYAPQKNDVYIYFRYNEAEKVMVILNKNSKDVTLDLGRYSQMIASKFAGKDIITGEIINAENTLTIKGKTAMIIEIEKEFK